LKVELKADAGYEVQLLGNSSFDLV